MKDVQVLKKELLELDVELKRFKQELLAARVNEFERVVHAPPGSLHRKVRELHMSIASDVY